MNGRAARLGRGAVTGAFATVVAASLHVSAGGVAPSGLAIALALVFATLLGVALTGRRPSALRLSLSVALSQAAFHLGFSYLGTDAGVASTGPAHHADFAIVGSSAHLTHSDDPMMWFAHVVAGALTIAFLVSAERSLWSVIQATGQLIVRAFQVPELVLPDAPPHRTSSTESLPALSARAIASVVSRRGPPSAAHAH